MTIVGKRLSKHFAALALILGLLMPLIGTPSAAVAEESFDLPMNLQGNLMLAQSGTGGRRSSMLQIRIREWTTEEERHQILSEIQESSAQGGRNHNRAVARALRGGSRVGTLNVPGGTGWSLRYSRVGKTSEGKYRIILATDRPVAFAEAWNSSMAGEFDVSVIQLTIDAEGKGEGTLSLGTEVRWNSETERLEVTNLSSQPIRFGDVRRTN